MPFRLLVMRTIALLAFMASSTGALAQTAAPVTPPIPRHVCGPAISQTGMASVYSESLDGGETASGGRLDMSAMTAAHPTLKFGQVVEITDTKTRKTIQVRINDRGPYTGGRIIDLTRAGYRGLGHRSPGLFHVTLKLCR